MFGGFGAATIPAASQPVAGFTFGTQQLAAAPPAPKENLQSLAATPAPSGGLFGSAGKPTNLFGSTGTAPPTGIFGSTATAPPVNATGMFGSTATAPPTGMFGSTATAPTVNATGIFGSTATAPPVIATGMFGSSATAPPGMFGSTPTAPPVNATGMFGSTATAPPVNAAGIFGFQPSTSLFGATQQPSILQTGQQQQLQPPLKSPAEQMRESLERLHAAWDPKSARCEFRGYFYNKVNPADVARYQQPPNTDPVLYEQAVRDNPDPTCMVPVLAVGFGDLHKRSEYQKQQCEAQRAIIEVMKEELREIRRKRDLEAVVQLEHKRRRQMDLAERCLKIMKEIHCVRMAGLSITADDEEFRTRTENVIARLRQKSLRARLNDLWAQVQTAKASGYLGGSRYARHAAAARTYAIADKEQYENIMKVYEEMGKGEKYLSETQEQDAKDLEIMLRELSASVLRP